MPEKDDEGKVRQFMPQSRYRNEKGIALSIYGKGPFCKFKIRNDVNQTGVYAIVVNGIAKYVGECVNPKCKRKGNLVAVYFMPLNEQDKLVTCQSCGQASVLPAVVVGGGGALCGDDRVRPRSSS